MRFPDEPTDPEPRRTEAPRLDETAVEGDHPNGGEGERLAGTGRDAPWPASPESERPGRRQKPSRGRSALEFVILFALALVAALALRTWVVEAYYIPSGSMVPTLEVGDRILVDKLSYDFGAVQRGNIVVFRRPPGDTVAPGIKDLVKRVIGLPGQTISSGPGGAVDINGRPISQPWLPRGTAPGPPIRTQVIPKGEYFVMGDNRANSEDSRFFGPISKKLIVVRVVMTYWPLNRFRIFG